MSLSISDIQKIARLARLALTPDEEERYARELSIVLDYFAQLNEVPTDDVPETCQVTDLEDITRPDVARMVEVAVREKSIAQFPVKMAGLLQVQAVFDGRLQAVREPVTDFDE